VLVLNFARKLLSPDQNRCVGLKASNLQVALGTTKSCAHPRGNVTGISDTGRTICGSSFCTKFLPSVAAGLPGIEPLVPNGICPAIFRQKPLRRRRGAGLFRSGNGNLSLAWTASSGLIET
jgi:hypothetical protein